MNLSADFLNFDIYPNLNHELPPFIYDQNQRQTLIVISENTPELLQFLSKIMSAVRYQLATDVLLVHLPDKQRLHLAQVQKTAKIQRILLFGVSPKQLGINSIIPKYYVLPLNNLEILAASALSRVSQAQAEKKELWNGLQTWLK